MVRELVRTQSPKNFNNKIQNYYSTDTENLKQDEPTLEPHEEFLKCSVLAKCRTLRQLNRIQG